MYGSESAAHVASRVGAGRGDDRSAHVRVVRDRHHVGHSSGAPRAPRGRARSAARIAAPGRRVALEGGYRARDRRRLETRPRLALNEGPRAGKGGGGYLGRCLEDANEAGDAGGNAGARVDYGSVFVGCCSGSRCSREVEGGQTRRDRVAGAGRDSVRARGHGAAGCGVACAAAAEAAAVVETIVPVELALIWPNSSRAGHASPSRRLQSGALSSRRTSARRLSSSSRSTTRMRTRIGTRPISICGCRKSIGSATSRIAKCSNASRKPTRRAPNSAVNWNFISRLIATRNVKHRHANDDQAGLIAALDRLYREHESTNRTIRGIMSNLQDLTALQTRLQQDVQTQANDIQVIQNNLTAQLKDLNDQIFKLQQQQPTLDLTALTMSVNQLESNHQSLLALAKQAAGAEHIPAPEPLISTAPSSDQPAPPAPGAVIAPAAAAEPHRRDVSG